MTSFRTAILQYLLAVLAFVTLAKSVLVLSFAIARLICTFH